MKNFDAINSVGENNALFKQSINKERVVVDVEMVLPFFQVCRNDVCTSQYEVKSKKIEGGVLKILWTYSNGHAGSWASSTVLCEKKDKKFTPIQFYLLLESFCPATILKRWQCSVASLILASLHLLHLLECKDLLYKDLYYS